MLGCNRLNIIAYLFTYAHGVNPASIDVCRVDVMRTTTYFLRDMPFFIIAYSVKSNTILCWTHLEEFMGNYGRHLDGYPVGLLVVHGVKGMLRSSIGVKK